MGQLIAFAAAMWGKAVAAWGYYFKTSKERQSETSVLKDKKKLSKALLYANKGFDLISNNVYILKNAYEIIKVSNGYLSDEEMKNLKEDYETLKEVIDDFLEYKEKFDNNLV